MIAIATDRMILERATRKNFRAEQVNFPYSRVPKFLRKAQETIEMSKTAGYVVEGFGYTSSVIKICGRRITIPLQI